MLKIKVNYMEIKKSRQFLVERKYPKVDIVFVENVQTFATSLAAMTHVAEGLCFNSLLTLKVENSLICLVGTRIPVVSKMEGQCILPLKTFTRNKASRCRRVECSVLKFK
jgi:hypothetical protein